MSVPTQKKAAALVARVVEKEIPNPSAVAAWQSLLRAHASLMRRLDADLRERTGSGLNEFDVLATVASSGRPIRMTELAERAYSSRSGMTRRVDQLVEQGLLSRSSNDADGRVVVVALTDAGLKRLGRLASAHTQGVREMFVSKLDPGELEALLKILKKVTAATAFG